MQSDELSTSTASTCFNIPPNDIHILPKMAQEKRCRKWRKFEGTVVLPMTPYKNELFEEQQKKEKHAENKKDLKNKKKLAEK